MVANYEATLEAQIAQWRAYLRRRPELHATDVEELETHLRDQVSELMDVGLNADEAFLIAVKRIGNLDALSREFAREHSDRLWKQLFLAPDSEREVGASSRKEFFVVVGLAVASALTVKVPAMFGLDMNGHGEMIYARNSSLFALPFLTGYFAWKRPVPLSTVGWLVLVFAAAAVFANAYPFKPGGATESLTVLHLPIALWLVVGVAYTGGEWGSCRRRMDFVRYSGELFIYYVLIALGGGVFTAFTVAMFESIGLHAETLAGEWLLPCGALGAVIVGSWLVEAKQSVIENMAPVLTRVFTPLFTVLLLAFLGTVIFTGKGIQVEREVLIAFDMLLALVLGLVLYAVSARNPDARPDIFDRLQLVLVVSALVVDVLMLAAISGRISEFGFSANRVAALGENLILFVNLAWSAWLYLRFLCGRGSFAAIERWQTAYLPVFAIWAWIVVIGFPPTFGYH